MVRVKFVLPAKEMYRLSRRRGNLCPGAEKAVSRRRGKVTFIHYRKKMYRFSRRRGKLCPGAGGSCVPAPGKLSPGAGEAVSCVRAPRNCFPVPGKNHIHSGFPGAGGSCVPAPENLFPGAGESCVPTPGKAHIHSVSKKIVRFSRRRGKLCPGAGKAVSRRESCFPAPWKAVSRRRESCFPASGKG